MNKSFGETLKGLMKEHNISSKDLAKELHIPYKSLTEYIGKSSRIPRDPDVIKKLAEYFKVSVHYLLFGEEDPHNILNEILEKTELHVGTYEVTIKKVKMRDPPTGKK